MKNTFTLFLFLFIVATNCLSQVRKDLISDFTPAQRTTLVNLMQQYITTDIIHLHCDYVNLTNEEDLDIHDDFNFMPYHRVYLEGMEDFLLRSGHPEFVPLPSWNPDTPTPLEFRLVDPDCMATNCTINVGNGNPNQYCDDDIDWTPDISIPSYLDDLCDYDYSPTEPFEEDEDGLSRQLEEPYHNEVHEEMGENMFSFASPASPIFWNWHAFLDDMWKDWECNCSQSTTADVDLYLKDNTEIMLETRDRGEEPNIDQGSMSNTEDVWVRNQQDGFTNNTHETPQYTGPTSPVYVYVRVRNRGCISSTGNEELSLHWAKGATTLSWPSHWNGSITYPEPMGDLISTQNISVTASQSSTVMEFEWIPPNPDDYNGANNDVFCLLARQVSTNDPMTFPEVSDIEDNVRDNNNIVWKEFTIENNAPLPIELSYFSGERLRNEVQLSWQTSSEINNKGFEIYRRSNTNSWENIGWVTGNGSTTQQHNYMFDDRQPEFGINYYRLKQFDFDGTFEYSKIIAVDFDKSNFDVQVFPNPTNRKFNIQIKNPLRQRMSVQIHDNLGMKVWESSLILDESGWNKELEIDRNGIYVITIQIGNEIYNERIVILGK
ncbi:MAG: tyrosinase family protein [Saprospiraceae bacterium]